MNSTIPEPLDATLPVTTDTNDLNLNMPPSSPKIDPSGIVNLMNWKNWLAFLLALILIFLAYPFTQSRIKGKCIDFYGIIIYNELPTT